LVISDVEVEDSRFCTVLALDLNVLVINSAVEVVNELGISGLEGSFSKLVVGKKGIDVFPGLLFGRIAEETVDKDIDVTDTLFRAADE
jgi:hypothetical protein